MGLGALASVLAVGVGLGWRWSLGSVFARADAFEEDRVLGIQQGLNVFVVLLVSDVHRPDQPDVRLSFGGEFVGAGSHLHDAGGRGSGLHVAIGGRGYLADEQCGDELTNHKGESLRCNCTGNRY